MNRIDLTTRRLGKLMQLLTVALAIWPAAEASAAPLPPRDLRVIDGEGWHADDRFRVAWNNVASDSAVAAVHYRLRAPDGSLESGPVRIGWAAESVPGVSVSGAGAHTLEVWLEDAAGTQGPPATVKLRFDRQRPGDVAPAREDGWIGRTELPYAIRLEHPPGPAPISGVRGYAVAIDRSPSSSPCADADLCTEAETDLRGGAGEDTLVVDELPEGTSYVHALAVSGSQTRSMTPGHATLRVDKTDPLTHLSGAPSGWTNRAVVLRATATDSGSGMAPSRGAEPSTAIRVDGEAPRVSPGDTATATVFASGIHTVAYYARDAAGNSDDGGDANGKPNARPATATVRIDRDPPAVVFTGSAFPEEPELIEARVSDGLSGPDPARGEIAVRAAGSGDAYVTLPTIAAGERLIARWRSDEYPVGEYEFRATAYDLAGNASSSSARANGLPMMLPNPLKSRAILVAGIAGAETERTIGYGHGATLVGSLSATSDSPLGGRAVSVVERFAGGAAVPRRTTVVPTAEDGRFELRLQPGPSREVFAVFDGTGTATGSASRPLRLSVRSGVELSASAPSARVGGRPVVFRGAVSSGPGELPPGGASVQLQFRAAGLPWSEFRTVQTNGRGRFRYPYRFSDDDSRGVRFQFRALVPEQRDWPYQPGASRPVSVRGA